jgi:hypothetical protein
MKLRKLFNRHTPEPVEIVTFDDGDDAEPQLSDNIPTLAVPPSMPAPVAYTEGMPAEPIKPIHRPGGIRKAKRPEWKPDTAAHGGRVVRRMPAELRAIKEKQEANQMPNKVDPRPRAHGELYEGEKFEPGITYMRRKDENYVIPLEEFEKLQETARLTQSDSGYEQWRKEWSVYNG